MRCVSGVFFARFLYMLDASHKQTCAMLNIYLNKYRTVLTRYFCVLMGARCSLSFSRPLHAYKRSAQKLCVPTKEMAKRTARGIFSARVRCYLHRFHPPTSSQLRRTASKCGMIQLIDTRRAIHHKCKTDAFCRRPSIRIDANASAFEAWRAGIELFPGYSRANSNWKKLPCRRRGEGGGGKWKHNGEEP